MSNGTEEGRKHGSGAALSRFALTDGGNTEGCGRLELQRRSQRRDITRKSLAGHGRVPSMLFDIEMEGDCTEHKENMEPCLDPATFERLKLVLHPSTEEEMKLREDVELAASECMFADNPEEDNQQLAQRLGQLYPDVRVRTALGGGDGHSCLRNLRHMFLTVNLGGHSYIIDLAFKEQFIIAKPTERYAVLLECLPSVQVAEEHAINSIVRFLCKEMAEAFQHQASVLPPWRCTDSMLSKWLPRRSMDKPADSRELPQPHPSSDPLCSRTSSIMHAPDTTFKLVHQQQLLQEQLESIMP